MNEQTPATTSTERARIRGDGYTAEAGWFGPEERPRFGWLYTPDTPATNGVGVVIVPPFGSEDMRAHRTLRHLAEDLAKAGFTALRFDLDGCGDSIGDDTEPARLPSWLDSVNDACDLVRSVGVNSLLLIGVRLGATLAVLAGSQRPDIAGLAAFNAVVRGRGYLRELRAFAQAMGLPGPPATMAWTEDGQETGGFLLTAETRDAVQAIDLASGRAAPAPRVLLLERDDLPVAGHWGEHLQSLQVDVVTRRIPGYVKMMDPPHVSRVAQEFIDACLEFAATLDGKPASGAARHLSLRPRIASHCGSVRIVEEVLLNTDALFGILARPEGAAAPERAVLMTNPGANRHIGSNRTDVALARSVAAAGQLVLRADLSGIGDSPARPDEPENIVYGPHAIRDIESLVGTLRARGARHIVAGGMCSGAYHVLRAALAGVPVDGLYLVNCGVFGPVVDFDPESADLFGNIAHYNRSVKSSRAWRKLLTGKVAFRSILRVSHWHLLAIARRWWRELARGIRLPLRNDLGTELRQLARRGVRVHFLFAEGEPGLALLRAEAGSVVPRMCRAGIFELRKFPRTDHTFTQRWAQVRLREALDRLLR